VLGGRSKVSCKCDERVSSTNHRSKIPQAMSGWLDGRIASASEVKTEAVQVPLQKEFRQESVTSVEKRRIGGIKNDAFN